MSERSWFIASDGNQEGPFLESQLNALIQAGRLTRDTLVWADGMAGWQRAADVPDFVFSAQAPPPPPPRSRPLPGGLPRNGSSPSGTLSADFGVWALLGRLLLIIIGTLLVVPAPWVFTHFYRWVIAHIHVPQRPQLAFTGQVGDIWWVFVLTALCSYAALTHIRYLPLLLVPVEAALSWMTIRWVIANISSEGRPLPLRFGGSVWGYIGWTVLLDLSFITIIGWAWVETALMRWVARNIEGTTRAVAFNASGWQILWRTFVLALTCIFIVPIPWMVRWYACWFVAQFSVDERMA